MTPDVRSAVPWLLFGLLASALAVHSTAYFGQEIDDAFINLRYAHNAAHGAGLTFNPSERVEGFTSLLVVLLETVFVAVGLPALTTMKIVGLAAGIATVGFTLRLALDLSGSVFAAFMAGAVLVVQPWFALDCVNGLDSALFTMAVTGAFALYVTGAQAIGVGLCLAVALLARPEGVVFAAALVAHGLLSRRILYLRQMVLPMLVLAVPILTWKVVYFGALVPNTAVAKLPPLSRARLVSGLQYVREFAPLHWDLFALASMAWLARTRPPFRVVTVTTLLWLGYVVFVGGDWMGPQRFLMPIQPLLAVGLVSGALAPGTSLSGLSGLRAELATVVLAIGVVAFGSSKDMKRVREFVTGVQQGTLSKESFVGWLKTAVPEDATLATFDVGVLAARTDLRILDLGGLTDKPIAEILHAGAAEYPGHLARPVGEPVMAIADNVVHRRPEFVLLNVWGDVPALILRVPQRSGRYRAIALEAFYPAEAGLLTHPDFGHDYRWVCSRPFGKNEKGSSLWYNLFARKDVELKVTPRVDESGHPFCE